jgi:SAM-dependent methyltransferase
MKGIEDIRKELSELKLPPSAEPYRNSINLTIAPDDLMFKGDVEHYFGCGAGALNIMLAALQLTGAPDPMTILDFGAGAGRVTRWLHAAFPAAAIDACDLRVSDMNFCAKTFGAKTWVPKTDVDSLEAPGIYDLIWAGSVVTHLSSDNTIRLLRKMISWTRPAGLIVLSFHGRYALTVQDSIPNQYIHDEAWQRIKAGYAATGYGYADYSAADGYNGADAYGVSVTKPSWITAVVEKQSSLRLVSLSERVWDNHHDILAVQVTQG